MKHVRKTIKRIFSFTLALFFLLALFPLSVFASEAVTNGTFGDALVWTLDAEGTLTISGSGAMPDYTYTSHAPWYNSRNTIKGVIIDNGVENIGDFAFIGCSRLESVIIGDNVTCIGDRAFDGCISLDSISIPENVAQIGVMAFVGCKSLSIIYFEGDAPKFEFTQLDGSGLYASFCFQDVTATVYYPEDNTTWTDEIMQDYDGIITWVPYETEGETDINPDGNDVSIYIPVVEACMDECQYSSLNIEKQQECRGLLYDFNGDGQDELVLQCLKDRDIAFEIWSVVDGKLLCVSSAETFSGGLEANGGIGIGEYGGVSYVAYMWENTGMEAFSELELIYAITDNAYELCESVKSYDLENTKVLISSNYYWRHGGQSEGLVFPELISYLQNSNTHTTLHTVEEIEQMVADYYNRHYQDEAHPGTYVVFHGETTVSGNTCNMVVRFQSSSSSPTTAANILVAFVSVDMRTGVMTIETIDGDIEVRLFGSVVEAPPVEIPAPIATMTAFNNFFVENYYDNLNQMYQYNSVAQGIVENSSVIQINWNSCLSALSNKEYIDVLKLENHPEYYYQTVLFESIMQTKLSDDYLSALADQISSISIKALSFYVSYDANFNSYEDVLKQKLNATMTDFSIDSVQYKRLKDYYGQYCKQLNSFETMKGIYDLVVKADGSVGDFFNALSRYTSVYEASEETITALKYLKKILELSTNEEDQYIITAVNNVLFSLERTLDRQLLLNCMATAKDLLWDVFWAAIQDAFPQMLAMDIASFTVDTGLALSNVLFPTTISSDSYCKVYADYAVETVMRQALYEAYNSYVASPTEEMATVTVGLYDLLGYTYAHEIEVAAVLSEQLHKDGFLNGLRNLFSEKNMATYEYEQECIKAYGAYLNDIKAVKVEAQTAYGLTTGSIQPVIVVYMVNGKVVTTTESTVATGDVYSLPSGEIDMPDFMGLYLEIGGYYTDEKLTNPYEESCVTKPLSLYCNVLLRRTSDQVPVLVDHSTGISVSRGESMENYVLRAELVESGNVYESAKKFFNGAELDLYDISLSFNGSTVQPDGSVLVQIPIDDEHAKMEGTVYYVVSDGKYSNVNATYENKSYYFRTTHFSNYLIVYESKESNWYIPLFVIVAICVMGVGVVMLSKKKKNRK